MIQVLLISNYWQWKPLAILSLLIRMVCYGINHAALLVDGQVHEMVGSSFRWSVKRLLGRPVSYAPNEGSGYKVTPLEIWLKSSNRKVVVMEALVPVKVPECKEGYGFLDLIQIMLHVIRRKWLLIGNSWNGKDGCRLWSGCFCSEFIGRALGREDAHILTPLDLRLLPELRVVNEFETRKK